MRVFVTGGTGFVGKPTVGRLVDAGHEVRCLVRRTSDTGKLEALGCEFAYGDVTDRTSVLEGMKGCEWVVHLANIYSYWEPDKDVYRRVNVEGTRNVMGAALEAGVRKVVHVSTALVWGEPQETPFTEETPVGPKRFTEYARTKYEGDLAVWELHRERGLPVVVLYPGGILGAGDPKSTGRYIRDLIERRMPARAFEGAALTLVHVRDVAEAIVRALEKEGNEGEKYLVGGHVVTMGELNRMVSEISGVPLPKMRLPSSLMVANAALLTRLADLIKRPPPLGLSVDQLRTFNDGGAFDGSKAERELGISYSPIREAIEEEVASHRSGGASGQQVANLVGDACKPIADSRPLYNLPSVRFERALPGTNEVFLADGTPRPIYEPLLAELGRTGPELWEEKRHRAHELLLKEQYSFGITEGDKTHPTDWIPRLVPASDWERLRAGLAQRLIAINEFLRRLEAGKEEVVPREVIESSILYDVSTPNRFGPVPVRQIAFDVVAVGSTEAGETGGWEYVVIEENAKMPVGLAAMTRRRKMSRELFFPESYKEFPVYSLDGWLGRLGDALRAASKKGPDATLAVVSGGPDDQFYLDHHIYAEEMDAILAETKDIRLDGEGFLVHEPTGRRIDVVYERVDEDRLYAEVPGLLECHVEGRAHVLFAPNSEIIDDKGVYAFVPEMVRTYLGEEPLIQNARTWSLAIEEDRKYVMDRFGELVVKSRGGYGGKEVMIGPEEPQESVERFRKMVEKNPVEYIAQEVIDFSTHVLCEADAAGEDFLLRDSYADYRMLVLAPEPDDPGVVEMVPGSLSRVAAPGKHIVNISSGGKMKDTWVLAR